jgi:hypothetical protein
MDNTKDAGDKEAFVGNKAIRNKLSEDANSIINEVVDKISVVLSDALWIQINEMIKFMTDKIFKIPEIRKKILETDETNVKNVFKINFKVLIQTSAVTATELFLSQPRGKDTRKKLMQIYVMELMKLDYYIEDGKRKQLGIVQFIANGKSLDKAPNRIDYNTEYIKTEVKESKKLPQINNNKELKSLPKEEETNNDEDNFDNLIFSAPSSSFEKVCEEIEDDFKEFLECMKTSVFYGSMVLICYNQELDIYRRKCLDLEDKNGLWGALVSK